MNVTLPPQLRQFVDREIKKGRFENASDAVADGLRLLQMRDHVAAGPAMNWALLGGMGDEDIMAMAFIVMMEAAKSAREDLRDIMESVKSINNAKAAMRELISKIGHDMAANTGQEPPLKYSKRGLGSEKAYHRFPLPRLDSTAPGGVRFAATDLHPGRIADATALCAIRESMKGDLDSMSEMGEMESLRLQMAMDRLSKLMSTLSNLLKKSSETSSGIIQNLK